MGAMSKKRWAYLKALRPSPGRYLHVSCAAWMATVPRNPIDPTAGVMQIPQIERPGTTYNVGRNQAKREKRAALKAAA